MPGPYSAKLGSATWNGTAIPDVRNINMNDDSGVKPYASSSTAGQMKRISGIHDKSGTFDIYDQSQAAPPFVKGDTGALVLTAINGRVLHNGPAYIVNINYAVNIESGDIVGDAIAWGQNPA